ncbi:MAG: DUF362 domain-containing protein, partial [Dehalococcoidia bacterium]|nr:DUF362 domain-containing protein [Dehalococcoidia bacterium]
MASKVYFMPDRAASIETSLVAKMLRVFDVAGFGEMIKPGAVVAIKIHCGEYNNTGYLRPVFPRAMADKIKSLGGRPFVCDTTTLTYSPFASRATALDEMLVAERNGFNSGTLGCPFIVADGFMGTDDVRVDLPEGFILKEAYVAQAIAMADVMIALTHFKGHPMGVVGGSIKNLGIGCQSKRGKYNVHMGGHPKYGFNNSPYFPHLCEGKDCPQWELCVACCPYHLFKVKDRNGDDPVFEWDREKCTNCLSHLMVNASCGVVGTPEENFDAADAAMADGALAVVKTVGRDKVGFINFAVDISPGCDCVMYSDRAIVPNLGVFASRDCVAIDRACVDMAKKSGGMPGSRSHDRGAHAP